ncbi:MAG TPA: GNAT family N-acetyltransferase [Myxococcota bacterium]|nr:GNAT family N-acetyltransferase [Myxococcota bacterium]
MNTAQNHFAAVRAVEGDDPERLAALRGEWSDLFEAAGSPNPFLSWEWQYTWWRTFARRRGVWILEARDHGGRLVGLLTLCARVSLGGARRFTLLGGGIGGADGLDALVRPGCGPAVRAAFAQVIASSLGRWDVLDLEDLPCGTSTIPALRAALIPRGVKCGVEPRFACPGFAVRGTFAVHLAGMRRRETCLRRRRWFERQPGFRIEVAERPEAVPEAVEDFLRLHHLRWDPVGGSGGIPRGLTEDFHRDVAPLLAERGWLRLYRLLVGGRSVAAVYGIEVGGRFYYYQSGLDPAWAARSPGLVLLARTVEDAYARRLTDYDFLRGSEPHKLDWAGDRRETCALRLRAPGLRSAAGAAAEEVFRAAREAARAIAPQRMWSTLRRMRRSVTANGLSSVLHGWLGGEGHGRAPVGRDDGPEPVTAGGGGAVGVSGAQPPTSMTAKPAAARVASACAEGAAAGT